MLSTKPARRLPLLYRCGLFLAAAAPLAFHNGVVAVFTLPKLAVLSTAVLLASVSAAWSLGFGASFIRRTPLDGALGAAALALAISAAASWDRRLSLAGMYNYYAYGLWGMGLVGAIYLLAASAGERERAGTLLAALACAALAGLYAILQVQGLEPFPQVGQVLTGRRAISTLGSPVSLGAYLALLFPLSLHRAAERGSRVTGGMVLLLLGGGLLASGSRAAGLSAAAGAGAWLWFSGRMKEGGRNWSARRWGLAAALLLAGTAGVAVRRAGRTEAAGIDSARLEIWKIAWNGFREHPWFGVGPDAFELYFRKGKTPAYIRASTAVEYQAHAHNDVLQAMATTGLAGTASYAALLIMLCRAGAASLADPSRRPLAAACAAGLLALFVNMKFNPVPLEALALGALLAGALAPGAQEGHGGHRFMASPGTKARVLAIFGIVSAVAAAVFLLADADVKEAQRMKLSGRPELAQRRLEAALSRRPCELSYHVEYVNFLNARAAQSSEPSIRLHLVDLAAASAEKAALCRPASSIAHYALGVGALLQAQAGRPERLAAAESALDRAVSLDPLFVPILQARLNAAQVRGEPARVREFDEKIRSLESLSRR